MGQQLIDFDIDTENQIITITQKGNIQADTFANTMKAIRNHEKYDSKFDLLNDCRNYSGPKSEKERQAFIDTLIKHGPKPPVKQALVVTPEEEINAAMLYTSKSIKESCAHTVIFQNMDAAKMWLGLQTDKGIDEIINDGLWAN